MSVRRFSAGGILLLVSSAVALAQTTEALPKPSGSPRALVFPGANGELQEELSTRDGRGLDDGGSLLFDGTDLFRYDNAFNRLVSATIHYPDGGLSATETRQYGYDLFGNITSISGSNPRNLSPDGTTNRLMNPFTYDEAGNLTSQPGWDSLGNPTGPADWFYAYDPFNMMTLAQKAGGSVVRRYVYTADDERLAVLPANGRELWTVRGPDERVLRDVEYLSTGWRWVEDYIHRGAGLLATIENTGGEKHHHLDHLGTPRLVTSSTGQLLARHVHAPYGEELTPENQNELRMKFTGHERDDLDSFGNVGDLDYMHARYHSSQLGRFLSLDPKSRYRPTRLPQRWNRYSYTIGNPLKYLDPDGRDLILADSSKTLRKFLVRSLTRPTFRAAAPRIANDKNFIVTVASARISSPAEVARQRRSGKDPEVTFGDATRKIKVVDGKITTTGADVRIDTAMVQREHPDPTGVVTSAHEIAGHAEDMRQGATPEEIEESHGDVEQLGYDVKNEEPDITEKEAAELLEELFKTPPE